MGENGIYKQVTPSDIRFKAAQIKEHAAAGVIGFEAECEDLLQWTQAFVQQQNKIFVAARAAAEPVT